MKNAFRLSLGIGLLLIASLAHAQSPSIFVDQLQPVIDDTVGPMAIGGASEQKLAQTVTVARAGRLRGIFLPISCDSGRLIIEIRNVDLSGAPGGVVLGRHAFGSEDITPVGPVFRFFRFGNDPDLSLVAGARFAIVLRNPTGSCGISRGPLGDAYTGGAGFFDARPNPSGWIPFSETETRLDLPFMAVMTAITSIHRTREYNVQP